MTTNISSGGRAKCELSFTVNGERRTVRVHPMERLLDVLRQELALTGAKEGCAEGECGSCSVLMDGALVNSCLVPILQAKSANIVTIEGLAAGAQLNCLQEAFLECGGAQCGICTPGMILAASHLLQRNPQPTIGRHPRRTFRKSLPLYRLRADFRRRRKSGAVQGQDVRSDPADYELVAPANLQEIVALLAEEPGTWLPIAGGTDVMVQYAAGKLSARKLVSIWNLPELRHIEVLADEVRIGAGCTYTDLRENETVGREFPLLVSAASWTGGIANQNRGTLGGNVVNASPAADSLPALLAYEAELILVSVRGERRVPYLDFHTDYKKTKLASDELIRDICLSRRFSEYFSYTRKVGARQAQAISKVCVAALGRLAGGKVEDVRIAVGSVAPVPLRLLETERIVQGKAIEPSLLLLAKKIAVAEIRPIDDIRSTMRYRSTVVGNLVAEFLEKLGANEPAI